MGLLDQAGAFIGAPVKKEIKWTANGEDFTFDVFIKPLSYHTAKHSIRSIAGDSDAIAARIAASVCDEQGQPVLSIGDITGDADPVRGAMCESLVMALLIAIAEVSGVGKQIRSLVPKTSFGANSSLTASAAKPLRKRKKP